MLPRRPANGVTKLQTSMNGGFGIGGQSAPGPVVTITRASCCPLPAVFMRAARTSAYEGAVSPESPDEPAGSFPCRSR